MLLLNSLDAGLVVVFGSNFLCLENGKLSGKLKIRYSCGSLGGQIKDNLMNHFTKEIKTMNAVLSMENEFLCYALTMHVEFNLSEHGFFKMVTKD